MSPICWFEQEDPLDSMKAIRELSQPAGWSPGREGNTGCQQPLLVARPDLSEWPTYLGRGAV